jgi:triosephosphate isomerase (TIM)
VQAQLDASLPHGDGVAAGVPAKFAIAYEPIWAIGTGKVASPADIGEMHKALRERLIAAYGATGREVRILYGGSVNASNAEEIFAVDNVDGALVGGASLTAEKFVPIVRAAAAIG